jgi:hypothetical protein
MTTRGQKKSTSSGPGRDQVIEVQQYYIFGLTSRLSSLITFQLEHSSTAMIWMFTRNYDGSGSGDNLTLPDLQTPGPAGHNLA